MKRSLTQFLLSPLLVAGLLLSPLTNVAEAATSTPVSNAVALAAKTTAKSIQVYVNGVKLSLSAAPFAKNGVTFVPMRPIFTALEAHVSWEPTTETIIGSKNGVTVTLKVGKKEATVNGKTIKLDAAPIVQGGVTFVPARFIGEALGAKVKWNNNDKIVGITTTEYELKQILEQYEKETAAKRVKLSIEEIVDQNDESVVLIMTNNALGSGVVIGDRWILTNHHVMQDANSATVSTIYGEEFDVSGVAIYSERSDIAIIQTKESMGIKAVDLGSGISSKKGEKVIAIGSPLGVRNTVSDGLISNIVYEGGIRYLQTSAPIDHGSSGGALFNEYGELIGITSSGYTSQADLNFAVSVSHAGILAGLLPEKPEEVAFLEPTLPNTLVGASMDSISELMTNEFGALNTNEGIISFTNWEVQKDSAGWYVFKANIDPVFYTYYGSATTAELRSWAINIGHELHRMLPTERIQMLISFDRTFGFEPRGFKGDEVTALGDDKWRVQFPVIDMQLKDQLYIDVRN
ncbi:MAG: stalk domain-containing protein [Candidatus Pristimantibacillus sp.]